MLTRMARRSSNVPTVEERRPALTRVAVAGAPPVDFCVDLAASDALVRLLLDHDAIEHPAVRTLLEFVGPEIRLLDLGSGLGMFALPAAAAGAHVIAVAPPDAAGPLRIAARRNGFGDFHVVESTMSELAAAGVEQVLEAHGWDDVDVIALSADGAEIEVIEALSPFLLELQLPPLVIGSEAAALSSRGVSVSELRELIAGLGYEVLLIDPRRPGSLLQPPPAALQPDAAAWHLAVGERLGWLEDRLESESQYGAEEVAARLTETA